MRFFGSKEKKEDSLKDCENKIAKLNTELTELQNQILPYFNKLNEYNQGYFGASASMKDATGADLELPHTLQQKFLQKREELENKPEYKKLLKKIEKLNKEIISYEHKIKELKKEIPSLLPATYQTIEHNQ